MTYYNHVGRVNEQLERVCPFITLLNAEASPNEKQQEREQVNLLSKTSLALCSVHSRICLDARTCDDSLFRITCAVFSNVIHLWLCHFYSHLFKFCTRVLWATTKLYNPRIFPLGAESLCVLHFLVSTSPTEQLASRRVPHRNRADPSRVPYPRCCH